MKAQDVRTALFAFLILFTGCSVFAGYSDSNQKSESQTNNDKAGSKNSSFKDLSSKSELERDVAKMLQGDQVLLRREIDKVFGLARIREDEGKEIEAIQLYEKALEVNSFNISYQMRLAVLLAKHNRVSEAVTKARIVFDLAEDEALINDAEDLLKSFGCPHNSSEIISQVDNTVEIILIPLGNVNDRVLRSLSRLLEQRMGIRFSIHTKVKDIGTPDRSFTTVFVRDYLTWLKERVGENRYPSLVSELGFTMSALDSYEDKIKFIYTLFERSGPDGRRSREVFDAELRKAENLTQYDGYRLLQEIRADFPLETKSIVKGYLAITDEDLFEGESRFCFGWAAPGYGVVSFRRFASAFNDEDQNRPRLINRALKQALSSANFVLGIPRCTNPDCARAYPNSLQELDRKPDTLCSLCRERLSAYLQSTTKLQ